MHSVIYREYWVSWTKPDIRVGKGNVVGESQLVQYEDEADYHTVNSIHFSSDPHAAKFEFLKSYSK